MAAFWAVFTLGGSGPALTAHGSLDLKQIQIQICSAFRFAFAQVVFEQMVENFQKEFLFGGGNIMSKNLLLPSL
jgi:hypothetical protein